MKIAMINGSPKTGENNSQYFADEMEKLLSPAEVISVRINRPRISDQEKELLASCDTLVFCFPLYVDSIPSHLLAILVELETFFRDKKMKPDVYAVINCGFYEGTQTHIALDIVQNWAAHAGLYWRQGVGVGAGEMLGNLGSVPLGKGPKTSLGKAFNALALNILRHEAGENIYVKPNFPRLGFLLIGSLGWTLQAKANGISRKDIYFKPS